MQTDPFSAGATTAAQPQPTKDRNIVTPSDRFLATRAKRKCWFEQRNVAGHSVNTTPEKRTKHQTDQEAEDDENHFHRQALKGEAVTEDRKEVLQKITEITKVKNRMYTNPTSKSSRVATIRDFVIDRRSGRGSIYQLRGMQQTPPS
jgi:hypothetical protein